MIILNPLNVGDLANELKDLLVQGYLHKLYLFPNYCISKIRTRSKKTCYLELGSTVRLREPISKDEQAKTILKRITEPLKNAIITDVFQDHTDRILVLTLQRGSERFYVQLNLFSRSTLILLSEARCLFASNKKLDQTILKPDFDSTFDETRLLASPGLMEVINLTSYDVQNQIKSLPSSIPRQQFLQTKDGKTYLLPFEVPELELINSFESVLAALTFLYQQDELSKIKHFAEKKPILVDTSDKVTNALERQRIEHLERIKQTNLLLDLLEEANSEQKLSFADVEARQELVTAKLQLKLTYPEDLRTLNIHFSENTLNHIWKYHGELNLYAIQNALFHERKHSQHSLIVISKRLKVLQKHNTKTTKASIQKHTETKKKLWFEEQNFRACLTSHGLLAVLGRSAVQNEILVSNYLEGKDRFCHGEFYGAPHLVLKSGSLGTTEDLEEACTLSFLFTNRWQPQTKHGLAYWVLPHQVTKQDPKGNRLEQGQFYIHGEKNFVQISIFQLTINQVLYEEEERLMISIEPLPEAQIAAIIKPSYKKTNVVEQLAAKFHRPIDQIRSLLPPGYSKLQAFV